MAPLFHDPTLKPIEQVLINRGIKKHDIEHFLNTSDEDILNSKLIKNIEKGAKMLVRHMSAGSKVFLQIDSDCDGYTSAATLLNYLNIIAPAFTQNNIIYRLHEGKEHGIILDTIPEDVKLVIMPDASSNDYDEHKALREKGIDILVIDHHEAPHESLDACVINNQLCDYPTKSLSGVGMVYKFCCYLDTLLNVDYAENFRDLASLGMIADMMDMRDFETRHLIMSGLNNIRNPFFKSFVDKQSFVLKDGITPIGIAFYVAPYINATVRAGTAQEKLVLFESMLDFKAYKEIPSTKRGEKGKTETVVTQACRNCTNVKKRQGDSRDAATSVIEQIIKENNLLDNKILVVKLTDEIAIDKTLVGLIANQLMSKYQKPVLLLRKREEVPGEITWEGSGRNYDKGEFDNLKEFLHYSGYFEYADGHANAFGAGIRDDKFNDFIKYANKELASYSFTPCYKVDFIYQGSNFKAQDIIEIAELKSLWGQGLSEPYVALEGINVHADNVTLMSADKNPTLKITLPNGVSLIKFKSSIEEYESFKTTGCITLNIVGRCERNVWNGRVSAQILIEDYDIEKVMQYYF
jgi:single-stranded-DNA-specific exonuclease